MQSQMKALLEPMFATDFRQVYLQEGQGSLNSQTLFFSPSLTVALREVVEKIPELKTDIQDGLLKQLSLILMHRPMPSKLLPPPPLELPANAIDVPSSDVPATVLALGTLSSFRFPRHWLEMFLKYVSAVSVTSLGVGLELSLTACELPIGRRIGLVRHVGSG